MDLLKQQSVTSSVESLGLIFNMPTTDDLIKKIKTPVRYDEKSFLILDADHVAVAGFDFISERDDIEPEYVVKCINEYPRLEKMEAALRDARGAFQSILNWEAEAKTQGSAVSKISGKWLADNPLEEK